MLQVIRLKSDGTLFALEVDEAHDGTRDRSMLPKDLRAQGLGVLVEGGGVDFRTKAAKRWFMKFTEFEFVFNPAGKVVAA